MFRKSGFFVLSTLAVLSAPAFASGYGPAPHYTPGVGAPASQRGPSAQTVAAEAQQSTVSTITVGGANGGTSQSGIRNTQPLHVKVTDNQ